jgi:hypothetical protein
VIPYGEHKRKATRTWRSEPVGKRQGRKRARQAERKEVDERAGQGSTSTREVYPRWLEDGMWSPSTYPEVQGIEADEHQE